MNHTKIVRLLQSNTPTDNVLIKGWVRTRRDSSDFSFIEVNDGSCLKNMQVIADNSLHNYDDIKKISTGSAVIITGNLIESQGSGQKWEIQAGTVDILSLTPESYPLQKKTPQRRVFKNHRPFKTKD